VIFHYVKTFCILAAPNTRPRLSVPGNIWASSLRRFFYSTSNTSFRPIPVLNPVIFRYVKTETKLPNGETAYIHLGRWRETQKMYIYAITKNLPENIETI
jgi:hypothetical protein